MRSIHFRVSDTMYARIQEEAEDQGVSPSHFAREAVVVRAAVYAHRRGMQWGIEGDDWAEVADAIERADRQDAKVRAAGARARRAAREES